MLILHITDTDPAGSIYNLCHAVNEHTPHTMRVIATKSIDQYRFPRDIHDIYDYGDEIEQLMTDADVFHLHKVSLNYKIEFKLNSGKTRSFKVRDYVNINGKKKKIVYHVHGAPAEREYPKDVIKIYGEQGNKILTATPDLQKIYREVYDPEKVSYFPNCVPINDVRYMPRDVKKPLIMGDESTRYAVVQTPTNAVLKNVHVIKDIVNDLAKKGLPIFYLQIWNTPIDIALRHQRNAHIVFDHLEGYYGISSLQGLSMGKPVIAGINEYNQKEMAKFWGITTDRLPWIIVKNRDEIKSHITDMTKFPDKAYRIGDISRDFMENIWSEHNIGRRLGTFYESI